MTNEKLERGLVLREQIARCLQDKKRYDEFLRKVQQKVKDLLEADADEFTHIDLVFGNSTDHVTDDEDVYGYSLMKYFDGDLFHLNVPGVDGGKDNIYAVFQLLELGARQACEMLDREFRQYQDEFDKL
jgi:hypothetical protein